MKKFMALVILMVMAIVCNLNVAMAERVTLDEILEYDSRLSADVIPAYNGDDYSTIYIYAGDHFTIECSVTSGGHGYCAMYESGHSTAGNVWYCEIINMPLDYAIERTEEQTFELTKIALSAMDRNGWD